MTEHLFYVRYHQRHDLYVICLFMLSLWHRPEREKLGVAVL